MSFIDLVKEQYLGSSPENEHRLPSNIELLFSNEYVRSLYWKGFYGDGFDLDRAARIEGSNSFSYDEDPLYYLSLFNIGEGAYSVGGRTSIPFEYDGDKFLFFISGLSDDVRTNMRPKRQREFLEVSENQAGLVYEKFRRSPSVPRNDLNDYEISILSDFYRKLTHFGIVLGPEICNTNYIRLPSFVYKEQISPLDYICDVLDQPDSTKLPFIDNLVTNQRGAEVITPQLLASPLGTLFTIDELLSSSSEEITEGNLRHIIDTLNQNLAYANLLVVPVKIQNQNLGYRVIQADTPIEHIEDENLNSLNDKLANELIILALESGIKLQSQGYLDIPNESRSSLAFPGYTVFYFTNSEGKLDIVPIKNSTQLAMMKYFMDEGKFVTLEEANFFASNLLARNVEGAEDEYEEFDNGDNTVEDETNDGENLWLQNIFKQHYIKLNKQLETFNIPFRIRALRSLGYALTGESSRHIETDPDTRFKLMYKVIEHIKTREDLNESPLEWKRVGNTAVSLYDKNLDGFSSQTVLLVRTLDDKGYPASYKGVPIKGKMHKDFLRLLFENDGYITPSDWSGLESGYNDRSFNTTYYELKEKITDWVGAKYGNLVDSFGGDSTIPGYAIFGSEKYRSKRTIRDMEHMESLVGDSRSFNVQYDDQPGVNFTLNVVDAPNTLDYLRNTTKGILLIGNGGVSLMAVELSEAQTELMRMFLLEFDANIPGEQIQITNPGKSDGKTANSKKGTFNKIIDKIMNIAAAFECKTIKAGGASVSNLRLPLLDLSSIVEP